MSQHIAQLQSRTHCLHARTTSRTPSQTPAPLSQPDVCTTGAYTFDGLSYGPSGKDPLGFPQDQGDEEMQQEEDQGEPPPSKIVTHQRNVQLRARVMVLDFSGLSDVQSTAMILGNVAPRHLILVNGSEQVRFRCCFFQPVKAAESELVQAGGRSLGSVSPAEVSAGLRLRSPRSRALQMLSH